MDDKSARDKEKELQEEIQENPRRHKGNERGEAMRKARLIKV